MLAFWFFEFPLRTLSKAMLLLKMQVLIQRSFECTFSDLFQQLIQVCFSLPYQLPLTFWKGTILYGLSLNASCQQHDS